MSIMISLRCPLEALPVYFPCTTVRNVFHRDFKENPVSSNTIDNRIFSLNPVRRMSLVIFFAYLMRVDDDNFESVYLMF